MCLIFPKKDEVFSVLREEIKFLRSREYVDNAEFAQGAIERLVVNDLYPTEDPQRLFIPRQYVDRPYECRYCNNAGYVKNKECLSCKGSGIFFYVQGDKAFHHLLDVAFWASLGTEKILRAENTIREIVALHSRKYRIPRNGTGRIYWRCSCAQDTTPYGRLVWPGMNYSKINLPLKEFDEMGIRVEPVIEDGYRLTIYTESYLYL